ncbi:SDR family NAD(P)-dependent oxidoreductase [Cryobacterium ruanii]|uniref:SDR family oxidoreductase n=1 Tax=Cryobacterium ruanii TaxID=1259197 RepID=A0A4R9AQ99_9MICO|nr:SDR family oxidoreductase [Cryobacterium ruanii]TFD67719.1 SDR family oxidoreductase [Cryobacterium ruanii]
MGRLNGQVAIVTGGARGIGLGIASRFAREGASVVLAQRSAEEGADAVASITAEGGRVITITTDITLESSVQGLIEQTVATFGRLDVLVNNAGTGVVEQVWDLNYTDYERVMNVNVGGTLLCTKFASRVMKEAGRGSIINISSIQGVLPLAQSAVYAATKGAVDLITKQNALDLGPFGIRVNAIAPGYIDNPMMHEYCDLVSQTPGSALAAAKKAIPLGRLGSPDDIAGAAVFFASDDAAWVTGTTLLVDGGSLCHGPLA